MLSKAATLYLVLLIIEVTAARNAIDFKHMKFEVFYPKGLKVSLPDATDITSFSIDGNINEPALAHRPGVLKNSTNVLRDNNYWTIEAPSLELRIGDEINYVCFVARGNLGYYHNGSFRVQEYASAGGGGITECQVEQYQKNRCTKVMMSMMEDLHKERDQISYLKKEIMILTAVLENHAEASKQMKLSGKLPTFGSPLAIARDIVREKLKSSVEISRAVKIGNEILFEVNRLADKLAIVKAAYEFLKYSRIVLIS